MLESELWQSNFSHTLFNLIEQSLFYILATERGLSHWIWILTALGLTLTLEVTLKPRDLLFRSWRTHWSDLETYRELAVDMFWAGINVIFFSLLIKKIGLLDHFFQLAQQLGKVVAIQTSSQVLLDPVLGKILVLVVLVLSWDLAYYWLHRILHSRRIFEIHCVHHRATRLSPLTRLRAHPIESLLNEMTSIFVHAIVVNIIFSFFKYGSMPIALTSTSIYSLYFVTAHLRHSHIWLHYGPWLSYILSSPAMHQIHHSIHPDHRHKNFAVVFSLWDYMFGTLYVPQKKENLTFGLTSSLALEQSPDFQKP